MHVACSRRRTLCRCCSRNNGPLVDEVPYGDPAAGAVPAHGKNRFPGREKLPSGATARVPILPVSRLMKRV